VSRLEEKEISGALTDKNVRILFSGNEKGEVSAKGKARGAPAAARTTTGSPPEMKGRSSRGPIIAAEETKTLPRRDRLHEGNQMTVSISPAKRNGINDTAHVRKNRRGFLKKKKLAVMEEEN